MDVNRRLAFASLVAVAASGLVACGAAGNEAVSSRAGSSPAGAAPAPGVPVETATVVQKSMPIEIHSIGSAEATATVAVHAQIVGQLTSVAFEGGDDVTEGQILFRLDPRPLQAALQQAEANLQRDVAQATNATAQAQRYKDLAERGIATREQVDQMTANAGALEATVAADRAAVESAKVQLNYATIASPISGRTGALIVSAGNLVQPTDVAPLIIINKITPMYVVFTIPEAQLPALKQYLGGGTLHVEALPPDGGPPSVGQLTFIDNTVDQTTGTIKIRGTFPNGDRRLWPGQFVNVTVTLTSDANAVVAPTAAIQSGQQGQYVFVVKPDETVEMRPVAVARTNGTETIISKGLTPGETIVTDGQLRLVPGSRIAVKSASEPKATP